MKGRGMGPALKALAWTSPESPKSVGSGLCKGVVAAFAEIKTRVRTTP